MTRCGVLLSGMAILMALSGIVPSAAQDSLNVTMVGSIYYPYGGINRIAVDGDFAYLADDQRIRIVDITNPYNPHEVSNSGSPWDTDDISISGNYLFRVGGGHYSELVIYRILTPPGLQLISCHDTPGSPQGVDVSGDYAYIADGDSGLRVVNVISPTSPYELSHCGTPSEARKVAVNNDLAYVITADDGVRVIYIGVPGYSWEVGRYTAYSGMTAIALNENYCYISACGNLLILSIDDPVSPWQVCYLNVVGWVFDISLSGGYVYIASGDSGLRVLDVYDPWSPVEVGFYDTPGYAYGVAVSGNYAYVADYYYFEIFDCSAALSIRNSEPVDVPRSYSLLPAYPNPFNAATTISYEVAASGRVQLVIYDLLGRQVGMLVDRTVAPGAYSVIWDAGDLASGIYFCRMSGGEAGNFRQVQKLVVLK